jgi:hypothetical protein
MLRVKYYDAVVAISREVELAKKYLGGDISGKLAFNP